MKKIRVISGDGVDWWPQFQHGPENIGYSTSTGPNTNNVLWTYTTVGGGPMFGSPIVVDGRVYTGSRGDLFTPGGGVDGVVYCLDAETGGKIWEFSTRFGLYDPPAVVDGKLYVCTGLWSEYIKGDVYCLDAIDGSIIWKNLNLEYGYVEGAPVVIDGKLYFAGLKDREDGVGLEGEIYCLDASTGDVIWNSNEYVTRGPVAVSNSKVYAGRIQDPLHKNPRLSCLNASTGEEIWTWNNTYPERDQVYGAPTVVNGKVYVGTTGWGVITPDGPLYFPGSVFCLNAENGSVLWKSSVEDAFWTSQSPAVAYGNVYIGSGSFDSSGNFYCLNAADGSLIWQRSNLFGSDIVVPVGCHAPAVADGKVYVSVDANDLYSMVYCFNVFTGETIWKYKQFGFLPYFFHPAVADDQLYVGFGTEFGRDGMIFCFADIDPDAPKAPKITGPSSVEPGEEYEYTFASSDPNDDAVYYYITWGDGTSEKWLGPHSSGETITVTHTWNEKGKYEIRARAKDTDGLRGAIGTLKINNPRVRTSFSSYWLRLIECFPILQKILLLQRFGLQ